jgi:putative transcriptional regulator
MTAGIYRIRNAVDGYEYIGSTFDMKLRWRQHRGDLRRGKHGNTKLQAAWDLHGEGVFSFDALEKLDGEDDEALNLAERRWIEAGVAAGLYNSLRAARRVSSNSRRRADEGEPSRTSGGIVCHLPDLLRERQMSVLALHRATGIAYTTLHALYHGDATRYDAQTLDKLCAALGCTVGDILEHLPER